MTEPVAALATTRSRSAAVEPSLRPRRAVLGDASYKLVFLVSSAVPALAMLGTGAPVAVAVAIGLMIGPGVTWLVDRLALAPRAITRFNLEAVPAGEAHARGRFGDAERIYADLARRYRGRPGLQAIALFHNAVARATRGEMDDAIATLEAIDAFEQGKRNPAVVVQVPRMLATLHAQCGRTAEARAWLAKGRAAKVPGRFYDAHIEAAILTREGRYQDADAMYASEWIDVERTMSQVAMRDLRVRRAFAVSHIPGREGDVEKLLAAVQPSRDDELAYLCIAWPELAAFVRTRGIVRDDVTTTRA